MVNVKIHSFYDPPSSCSRSSVNPSMTKQSFAQEADINHIMARYMKTGYLVDPLVNPTVRPSFGDFSAPLDFQHAQDLVNNAYDQFDSLPSAVRERFSNDPFSLLQFLSDKSNYDEAVKLGIVAPNPPVVLDSVDS